MVWWAALCQKVQGHFLAPVHPCLEVLLRLTSDAVDHERVQLFLAVLPLSGEVGHGLHLAVEQVVQQRQGHLLRRATVGADVQHVC